MTRRKATPKKPPSKYARQEAYAAEKLAAGEHLAWLTKAKAAEDVAAVRALQERFPDLTLPALTRLALRELAAKKNRR